MTRHAFIDESGTKDDQVIMTVAMIVLEGQFLSNKIQGLVLKEVFPERFAEKLNKKNKTQPALGLHYCDTALDKKIIAGKVLRSQSITCYAGYYYHDDKPKKHEERFAIYRSMVKTCILQSLEDFVELDITVAAQGGAKEYRAEFLADLQAVVEGFREYRKAKFRLGNNANPGVQLADFYSGAIRDHLIGQMKQEKHLLHAFEIIQEQVRDLTIEAGLEVAALKAKG